MIRPLHSRSPRLLPNLLFLSALIALAPSGNAVAGEECELNEGGSQSNGEFSFACGRTAQANGNDATAVGNSAFATADRTVALGRASRATADDSTAIGEFSDATALRSTAVGQES